MVQTFSIHSLAPSFPTVSSRSTWHHLHDHPIVFSVQWRTCQYSFYFFLDLVKSQRLCWDHSTFTHFADSSGTWNSMVYLMESMICRPGHHLIVNLQRSKTPPPHLTLQSLVATVHGKPVVVTRQFRRWSSFGPIWSKSAGTHRPSLAVRDSMEAAFNTTQMQAELHSIPLHATA